MILNDQQVCSYCGKAFPLSPDGSDLYAAHMLAEVAIERGCAKMSRTEGAMRQGELFVPQKKGGQPGGVL